ncbi:hypothetical protein EJ08DRAFT_657751 [Tothia fuscella]|uniref:J domain-containing protein n=1 Tax=Tothia fuscella TaxID=1048955 RepID=A0A9P4NZR4_9PEZI|nr:hypothetical protein EJ08DRAFT_657751 [Tothia fuscella]
MTNPKPPKSKSTTTTKTKTETHTVQQSDTTTPVYGLTLPGPLDRHYAALGLPIGCTRQQIRAQYTVLSKKHRPAIPEFSKLRRKDLDDIDSALYRRIQVAYDALIAHARIESGKPALTPTPGVPPNPIGHTQGNYATPATTPDIDTQTPKTVTSDGISDGIFSYTGECYEYFEKVDDCINGKRKVFSGNPIISTIPPPVFTRPVHFKGNPTFPSITFGGPAKFCGEKPNFTGEGTQFKDTTILGPSEPDDDSEPVDPQFRGSVSFEGPAVFNGGRPMFSGDETIFQESAKFTACTPEFKARTVFESKTEFRGNGETVSFRGPTTFNSVSVFHGLQVLFAGEVTFFSHVFMGADVTFRGNPVFFGDVFFKGGVVFQGIPLFLGGYVEFKGEVDFDGAKPFYRKSVTTSADALEAAMYK